MIDFHKILKTKELTLRPIKKTDFDEMWTLTQDPALWDYFTVDLSKKEHLMNWIISAEKAMENKERLAFTVLDNHSQKIMGSTSLGNYSERDKRIEIGWTWLAEEYRGRGINQKVKRLLLNYCFEELELERIECKTDVLNIAARKGLEKSGFTEEGVLRSHTLLANGRRRDSIYYSILKKEYLGIDQV